jgi:valyl-tRNA synthetase
MSKSAGNGIDPLLLIERYGADALRFAMVRKVAGAGQDIRLDYDRKSDTSATVEAARNFATKLWNATRFALMNLGGETPASLGEPDPAQLEAEGRPLQLADRWILSRLARVNRETAERYGSYALGEAARGLYEFAWNEVCDWYVELVKRRLQVPADLEGEELKAALADQCTARQVLAKVLTDLLVMLHPLLPHLTEELWHGLTGVPGGEFLALQDWPVADETALDEILEENFVELFEMVRTVRNLRALAGLKPSQVAPVLLTSGGTPISELLDEARPDIEALTRTKCTTDHPNSPQDDKDLRRFGSYLHSCDGDGGMVLKAECGEIGVELSLEGLVDRGVLRERMQKDKDKADKEIASLCSRLENPSFADKAPPEIVAECRENLANAKNRSELARRRLVELG